ncbi:MAG: gluconate 2-dehydrogenase subunit 3 family protein [Acidobacteriaceae bacterium]|nr:gluconate 2-dehydrogenase subunit 3 family protein [Acidobacteriaceae bacterium]
MANQSPDRRQVLEMLAKVAVMGQFPGFSRWVCAAEHVHESSQPRPSSYHPQFFTAAEYATIDELSELIIPADESPGAREAGVAEFIDFMTASDSEIQYPFRTGLTTLDASAIQKYGSSFVNLREAQQIELLSSMKNDDFFKLIREYTVMGYYTSRIGLEELNYPGLRIYSQSPACPHKNDPEHKHLPPPRF